MDSEPRRLPLGAITSSDGVRKTIDEIQAAYPRISGETNENKGRWVKEDALTMIEQTAPKNGA